MVAILSLGWERSLAAIFFFLFVSLCPDLGCALIRVEAALFLQMSHRHSPRREALPRRVLPFRLLGYGERLPSARRRRPWEFGAAFLLVGGRPRRAAPSPVFAVGAEI